AFSCGPSHAARVSPSPATEAGMAVLKVFFMRFPLRGIEEPLGAPWELNPVVGNPFPDSALGRARQGPARAKFPPGGTCCLSPQQQQDKQVSIIPAPIEKRGEPGMGKVPKIEKPPSRGHWDEGSS